MIVYVDNIGDVIFVSPTRTPHDQKTITEYDVGSIVLLENKAGFSIKNTWDASAKKLIQEHVPIEGYVPPIPDEPTPPIEEQILYETKYQTMLLEMGGMV